MITQYFIDGKSGRHIFKIKGGKYYDNNEEITVERYNLGLEYFNANRAKK